MFDGPCSNCFGCGTFVGCRGSCHNGFDCLQSVGLEFRIDCEFHRPAWMAGTGCLLKSTQSRLESGCSCLADVGFGLLIDQNCCYVFQLLIGQSCLTDLNDLHYFDCVDPRVL